VSYAIGVAEPLSIFISSYGTGIKSDSDLLKIVKANFDLRPGKIVKYAFGISLFLCYSFNKRLVISCCQIVVVV